MIDLRKTLPAPPAVIYLAPARPSAIPHNVERSAFRRGEYVGYASDSRPGVYRIARNGSGQWVARRFVGAVPTSDGFHYGRTLAEVGAKL